METRQLRFAFFLFSTMTCSSALGADGCVEALTASITQANDVRSCGLLSTVDGRVVTVLSGTSAFVKSQNANISTFYRIDLTIGSVEVKFMEHDPWLSAIHGAQTLPDAKSFYFPFYLSVKNDVAGTPGNDPRISCIPASGFSAMASLPC
jgi:hypothetical protein